MKRILITGGSGFLGQCLKHRFAEDNVKLWSLGKRVNNHIKCDIVFDLPLLPTVDIVIHAAGMAHSLHRNNKSNEDFFNVNVQGTINLLKALQLSHLPKSFVFISSVSVYGKDNGIEISENEQLRANDPYGLSKIKAEQLVLDWCEKHKVICTILRLPLLVGPNAPGNLGAMIKGISNGYYFNITGCSAKKSMVLVEDVANNILKIAEIGGTFNLTDGYHPSLSELSNHIAFQLGKGKPMQMPMWLAGIIAKLGNILGSKAPLNASKLKKITSNLTFDDRKAREAFGWNPTPVLEGFRIK